MNDVLTRSTLPLLLVFANAAFAQTPGFGELSTGFGIGTPGSRSARAALADLDGDGDLDLVVGNGRDAGDAGIYGRDDIFRNDGGTFIRLPGAVPDAAGRCRDIVVRDLDGDGRPDVLLANESTIGPGITYLRNLGGMSFADVSSTRGLGSSSATGTIAVADFDQDGDDDIVAYPRSFSISGRFFRNQGGSFSLVNQVLPQLSDTTCLVAGDIDGDGDVDLVCGRGESPQASSPVYRTLLRNDGTGLFGVDPLGIAPSRNVAARAMRLRDLDLDGDLDLVCANAVGANEVFQNSSGRFVPFPQDGLPTDAIESHDVVVHDFDHDTFVDLLFARVGGHSRLFFGDGTGRFAPRAGAFDGLQEDARGLAVGDVDGDGAADVVHVGMGIAGIWYGDGSGLRSPDPTCLADLAVSLGHCVVADIDEDGLLDLVGFAYSGGTNAQLVALKQTPGGFVRRDLGQTTNNSATRGLAVLDADGDGDEDILVAENSLFLLRNDGSGNFLGVTREVVAGGAAVLMTPADLDADGDLDVVCYGEILWNDGSGTFLRANPFGYLGGNQPTQVAVGDIDGDKDLDVLFDDPAQALFLNVGFGSFTAWGQNMPAISRARGCSFGDMDGDGDLDALYCREFFNGSPDTAFLENDGTGRFTLAPGRLPSGTRWQGPVYLADFDGDGDVDALGTRMIREPVLLTNVGGSFVDQGLLPATYRSYELRPADFDRDGDLDVAMIDGAGNRLYLNLLRHVTSTTPHVVGGTCRITVLQALSIHAPGLVALWGATQAAATPLPFEPLGLFQLDPATTVSFGFRTLSATDDRAVYPVLLPAAPALNGAAIHWQAATLRGGSLAEARFTNRSSHRVVR